MASEDHESGQRYVRFNLDELGRLAAEAIGSKSCVTISKYPGDMYNKTFLLTMDNGVQAIAKLPTPNAGLPHLTTASEVATMDFVSPILMLILQVIELIARSFEITYQLPSPKSMRGAPMRKKIL